MEIARFFEGQIPDTQANVATRMRARRLRNQCRRGETANDTNDSYFSIPASKAQKELVRIFTRDQAGGTISPADDGLETLSPELFG